ncbi:hypothetical protein QP400_03755 [Winkia sp. UMB3158]|uniref:hypothetical protein n=1 Tax=Winkia TaxID=2692118 RepID=UPI0011AEC6A2|nr:MULTISPECIES: hypothetical protein [Winkia]MBS5948111.1 hypothetical protein [Winkia neuii]MDK6240257.1 hypothetical protein [Winkia sp. UMB10116]MDK7149248.1 hypothetical protein [Winkia sp. UMB3158]MDK7228606.1 hypothetical protein [Winkia sp. UMB1185]MDK7905074.1 hypothetical protein [Winkia sp. UMB0889B]
MDANQFLFIPRISKFIRSSKLAKLDKNASYCRANHAGRFSSFGQNTAGMGSEWQRPPQIIADYRKPDYWSFYLRFQGRKNQRVKGFIFFVLAIFLSRPTGFSMSSFQVPAPPTRAAQMGHRIRVTMAVCEHSSNAQKAPT